MRDLFAQLPERFDFVLVDTPPVLPVTDAMVMDKLTGGALMAVAANRTRKRHDNTAPAGDAASGDPLLQATRPQAATRSRPPLINPADQPRRAC